jgi:hypothetical protein
MNLDLDSEHVPRWSPRLVTPKALLITSPPYHTGRVDMGLPPVAGRQTRSPQWALQRAILLLSFVLALLPNAFTRGEAPPGKEQYYGCEKFNECNRRIRASAFNPNLKKYCKRHGMPMDIKIYKDKVP